MRSVRKWEYFSGLDLDGLDDYEARRAIWLNHLARNAALTGKEMDDRLRESPSLPEDGWAYDFDTIYSQGKGDE